MAGRRRDDAAKEREWEFQWPCALLVEDRQSFGKMWLKGHDHYRSSGLWEVSWAPPFGGECKMIAHKKSDLTRDDTACHRILLKISQFLYPK